MKRIASNVRCCSCRKKGHTQNDCKGKRRKPDGKGAGKGGRKSFFVVSHEEDVVMITPDVPNPGSCKIYLNVAEGCVVPGTGAGVPACGPRALAAHKKMVEAAKGVRESPAAFERKRFSGAGGGSGLEDVRDKER